MEFTSALEFTFSSQLKRAGTPAEVSALEHPFWTILYTILFFIYNNLIAPSFIIICELNNIVT